MSRFGGLSEERPSVFRPEASLVLIYRPNVAGMKGRVDLAQPVNRTPDLWTKELTYGGVGGLVYGCKSASGSDDSDFLLDNDPQVHCSPRMPLVPLYNCPQVLKTSPKSFDFIPVEDMWRVRLWYLYNCPQILKTPPNGRILNRGLSSSYPRTGGNSQIGETSLFSTADRAKSTHYSSKDNPRILPADFGG
ncbi:hypothetical protein TNCV_531851 [Trichonephila clavipes]|nr:hypothetical protein TNCV_531851 [Trichonephila clavipes]